VTGGRRMKVQSFWVTKLTGFKINGGRQDQKRRVWRKLAKTDLGNKKLHAREKGQRIM